MATFTEHLGLHQWVAEDNFLRTDFNADLLAIDQAVHQAQTSLDGRIDTVNATLDSKIDSVSSTLDGKINTVNTTLNSKIDSTKTSLTNTINTEKQTLNTTITNTKNELNGKITTNAAAIAALEEGKCGILTGSYAGDDVVNRFIDLGATPLAVLVVAKGFLFGDTYPSGILLIPEIQEEYMGIREGGFYVSNAINKSYTNNKNLIYRYFAFIK